MNRPPLLLPSRRARPSRGVPCDLAATDAVCPVEAVVGLATVVVHVMEEHVCEGSVRVYRNTEGATGLCAQREVLQAAKRARVAAGKQRLRIKISAKVDVELVVVVASITDAVLWGASSALI